jgi:hypothetical protein
MSEDKCGRVSEGYLLWPGRKPMPMCSYHKIAPLNLAGMMGWGVTFTVTGHDDAPCESLDPHPDDKESE